MESARRDQEGVVRIEKWHALKESAPFFSSSFSELWKVAM